MPVQLGSYEWCIKLQYASLLVNAARFVVLVLSNINFYDFIFLSLLLRVVHWLTFPMLMINLSIANKYDKVPDNIWLSMLEHTFPFQNWDRYKDERQIGKMHQKYNVINIAYKITDISRCSPCINLCDENESNRNRIKPNREIWSTDEQCAYRHEYIRAMFITISSLLLHEEYLELKYTKHLIPNL